MKFWRMKSECLQDEGVDSSSHRMRVFVWDFEGSQKILEVPRVWEIFVLNQLKFAPSQLLPVFSEFDQLQTCRH